VPLLSVVLNSLGIREKNILTLLCFLFPTAEPIENIRKYEIYLVLLPICRAPTAVKRCASVEVAFSMFFNSVRLRG
jgi:hypothetical protein